MSPITLTHHHFEGETGVNVLKSHLRGVREARPGGARIYLILGPVVLPASTRVIFTTHLSPVDFQLSRQREGTPGFTVTEVVS